jgi:hypothetical protein
VREVEERVGAASAAAPHVEYFRKEGGSAARRRCRLDAVDQAHHLVTDGASTRPEGPTRSKALRFIIDRLPQGPVERIAVLHAGAPDIDESRDARERVSATDIVAHRSGHGVHRLRCRRRLDRAG